MISLAAPAVEAATMTEDPAVIEPAMAAASEAAPAEMQAAIDAVIAQVSEGNEGSPEFTSAYLELTAWVKEQCGVNQVCFLPTGATPENMAKIQAGGHQGTAHFTVGMAQEVTVS